MSHDAEILVIDDEFMLRQFICEVLDMEGIRSAAVTDGCEAIAYFEEAVASGSPLPRIIMLDLFLPCMDGQDVYNKIIREPWMRGTAIVYTTAGGELLKTIEGYPEPYVLRKPYEVAQLLNMLRQIAPELFDRG